MSKRMIPRIRMATFFMIFLTLLFPLLTSCIVREPDELVRNLTWAYGTPLPAASDFAGDAGTECEYSFAKDPYTKVQIGENTVVLQVRRPNGKTVKRTATLTLVEDTEAPRATGIHNLEAARNTPVSLFWDGITVTDNCDGPISRSVDTSGIDYSKLGVYEITYTVSDHAGNQSRYIARVEVVDRVITTEMLHAKLDERIRNLGLQGQSVLEQCRRIYSFVNNNETIHYKGTSNDPARVSWVREAYLALETEEGDCYTYFALSKAFFERLGIQNLDVQRLPGATSDTHYWSMVNIGTESDPRWYHFDATRLMEPIYSCGILTDSQVQYYSENIRPYFYYYDTLRYPATDTEEVSQRIN